MLTQNTAVCWSLQTNLVTPWHLKRLCPDLLCRITSFQLTLDILTIVHYLNKIAVPKLLRCNSSLMFGKVSAMADADAAYCNQRHSTSFITFIWLALR